MWHPEIPEEYRNQIITGDARELAARIPDQCAALAFADPPYWVNFDYGHAKDSELGYIEPEWLVNTLLRIATTVCVTPGMRNLWLYPQPKWVLGWFKFGSTSRSDLGGFNVWEPVLVYGTPQRGLWQDAINLPSAPNLLPTSIKKACPKPERLLRWLIEGFTQPDDLIVDLTVGTGTTAAMAKAMHRNYIAFEIDPETAQKARQRVLDTQPPLFAPEPVQAVWL